MSHSPVSADGEEEEGRGGGEEFLQKSERKVGRRTDKKKTHTEESCQRQIRSLIRTTVMFFLLTSAIKAHRHFNWNSPKKTSVTSQRASSARTTFHATAGSGGGKDDELGVDRASAVTELILNFTDIKREAIKNLSSMPPMTGHRDDTCGAEIFRSVQRIGFEISERSQLSLS